MCNVASKVLAYHHMPSRAVLLIQLLLDTRRNILLNIELFQRSRGNVDDLLLHVVGHISVLDHSFRGGRRCSAGILRTAIVGGGDIHLGRRRVLAPSLATTVESADLEGGDPLYRTWRFADLVTPIVSWSECQVEGGCTCL